MSQFLEIANALFDLNEDYVKLYYLSYSFYNNDKGRDSFCNKFEEEYKGHFHKRFHSGYLFKSKASLEIIRNKFKSYFSDDDILVVIRISSPKDILTQGLDIEELCFLTNHI